MDKSRDLKRKRRHINSVDSVQSKQSVRYIQWIFISTTRKWSEYFHTWCAWSIDNILWHLMHITITVSFSLSLSFPQKDLHYPTISMVNKQFLILILTHMQFTCMHVGCACLTSPELDPFHLNLLSSTIIFHITVIRKKVF